MKIKIIKDFFFKGKSISTFIMRAIILFISLTLFSFAPSGVLSQNVKIVIKNDQKASVDQIFNLIKKQTNYRFAYRSDMFNGLPKVQLEKGTISLNTLLEMSLSKGRFKYELASDNIIIIKEISAQPGKEIEITGKVVDEEDLPMPGVTVKVTQDANHRTIEAITNSQGEFKISCLSTDIIEFSYVGYQTNTFHISSLPQVITMKPAVNQLDAVQIIGYGTTTQRVSTGSFVHINSKDIAKMPVNNILLALQGQVAGMQISQGFSAITGNAPTVKIRGTNSIAAGTSPLYILDGVPVPDVQQTLGAGALNGNLSALLSINPADIESVEVLKDADATSIYGSRGANGVVLITTKKGKAGGTTVDFNSYAGFSKVAHFIDLMDVNQYNAMRREALKNDGYTPDPKFDADLFYDSTKVHNWQKELIGGNAAYTEANVSVSGGDDKTTFYINGGYHNEGTVFPGSLNTGNNNTGNTRKSLRFSVNHSSQNKKFDISLIGGYSDNNITLPNEDFTKYIFLPPAYPLYTATGEPNWDAGRGFPLATTLQLFNSQTDTYNGQVTLNYKPITGLNIKIDGGINNTTTDQTNQQPLASLDPLSNSGGSSSIGKYLLKTWIIDPQIDYSFKYKENNFNVLAGGTWQKNTTTNFTFFGGGYTDDSLLGTTSAAAYSFVNNANSQYSYESVFGRFTYNYNEKYLVNATYRRDGSSRFGPGKRFGDFGSIGLGWIFTQEKGIKDMLPFLSYGKIRGSYGTNGNDQILDYGYLSYYVSSSPGYQGSTLSPGTLANADYRWELNHKIDFALELGFLNDRIIFSTDVFRNRTDNQLLYYTVSPQSGFSGYVGNFPAKLQNQGIEFQLSSQNFIPKNRDGFGWKTSINLSTSSNKLLSFPGLDKSSYYDTYIVGQSINLQYAYQYDGLDAKGVPILKDANGDGTIDGKDRKVLGNNNPFFGGMTNDLSYKGFGLNFLWQYSHVEGFSKAVPTGIPGSVFTNQTTGVLDRWQKPGDESTTQTPAFTSNRAYNLRFVNQSTLYTGSRDIFRLSNVSLSYSLPQDWVQKLDMKQIKLVFQGQNLWVPGISKYVLDPESGNSNMPPLRTLTFGINGKF